MPYAEYLQTPEWRRARDGALRRAGFRCELPTCGSKEALQVHHREYVRLGEEVPEDLTVLCGRCHAAWHGGFLPGRPTDSLAVYVALAHEILRQELPESISDFVAAIKARCGRLRLPYREHQVDRAVDRLLLILKNPFPDVPVIPRQLLPSTEPSFSHSEAVEILGELGIGPIRTIGAVRQLSAAEILERQWRIDRAKAHRLVQQEILATIERTEALEATVEAARAADVDPETKS